MKPYLYILAIISLVWTTSSCSEDKDNSTQGNYFDVSKLVINEKELAATENTVYNINPQMTIDIYFDQEVSTASIASHLYLVDYKEQQVTNINYTFPTPNCVRMKSKEPLPAHAGYQLRVVSSLQSVSGAMVVEKTVVLYFTPERDDALLDKIQEGTLKYFTTLAEPTSGMARERATSGTTVTTGGTGFGVMALIVGAERGFISRQAALEQVQRIVTFLDTKTTKYHGAYTHWINGSTGKTIPFSPNDNGGDLVETALLFQGLLTARAYFDKADQAENQLREDITKLWEAIEWDWYIKDNGNSKVLLWHWSPDKGWVMNLDIRGWNESLIVYVLAASSPTHSISKDVYDQGWASNGGMRNGRMYYGIKLPLGMNYGGPLFFSHYSFMGIDPRGLKDQYCDNYLEQNKAHALIHYQHSIVNPGKWAGYGPNCWGLTASDGNPESGWYNARHPENDQGVIAPTAALASMPYTPTESLQALNYYYYILGDKLWRDEGGFADAFNLTYQWYDTDRLAIDQGPIVVMIENYRTGLLWDKFMSIPDIKQGMQKLGFTSPAW